MSIKPKQWVPHAYQEEAVKHNIECLIREGGSGLFLQPGLGKTSITLETFKRLKERHRARTMLIVAPLRVCYLVWPNEIQKWLNFYGLTCTILHGADKEAKLRRKTDIYIINYEGLSWLLEQRWKPTDVIVFDELTRMKSWTAKRVKEIRYFLPLFRFRIGLTGTPAPHGLEDLFSQIFMLDLGKRLGTKITHFRTKYFQPANKYSYKLEPYSWAKEEIASRLKDLIYTVNPNDCIDLPEILYNPIYIELPDILKGQYRELEKEFILELNKHQTITAVTAATLSNKLRQFLSGNVYIPGLNPTMREVATVHTHKLDVMKEFVENLNGTPLFVGYHYQHELVALQKAFPEAKTIGSRVKMEESQKIQADWNAGKIPMLLGQPASVGHGLNLQESCNNVLFYSLDFNYENHEQFIKRVARQGQKHSTVVINIIMYKDTIDEKILRVLEERGDLQAFMLDYLDRNGENYV